MKLADILGLDLGQTKAILTGKPEATNIETSDGELYYIAKLKEPVTVRCSVDPNIDAFETDEVYIRESALTSEEWVAVDEKKPEDGFYMPNWVVDFSKGHEIPVYQAESIKKWARGQRDNNRDERRKSINDGIREKMKSRNK